MSNCLFIDGRRSGYATNQCEETLTVGQLIKILREGVEWGDLDRDMPVYISNDNGYTYGEINPDRRSFQIGSKWERDGCCWEPCIPDDDEDEEDEYDD